MHPKPEDSLNVFVDRRVIKVVIDVVQAAEVGEADFLKRQDPCLRNNFSLQPITTRIARSINTPQPQPCRRG